jgi:hypothetical protein
MRYRGRHMRSPTSNAGVALPGIASKVRYARFILIAIVALGGCNDCTSEKRVEERKTDAAVVAPGSCDALGQKFCEETPVGCDVSKELFARAELKDEDCQEGLEAFAALDQQPPDTRSIAASKILMMVMGKSPAISKDQLEAVEAIARASAMNDAVAADTPDAQAMLTDVRCPGVSTRKGNQPPEGRQLWCETADGKRHGPAVSWNDEGEVVRSVEYENDAITDVRYFLPASGQLPSELFVCPKGQARTKENFESLVIRQCKDADDVSLLEVIWKDGKVIKIEDSSMPEHPENRFVGFMEQP